MINIIVWNEKIRKSEDIIKGIIDELYKLNINTDGVVEIFNDGKEQGCLLKIYDKYNPNLDLCFWLYMPEDRSINNEIKVIIGKHINCNELNMWNNSELETVTFSEAREMHNKTRDFISHYIKDCMSKTHDIPRL